MIRNAYYATRRFIFYLWARFKHPYLLWLLVNSGARRRLKNNPPHLDELGKRIVNDMRINGIATVHLDELFPQQNMLEKLQHYEKAHRHNQQQYHKKKFFIDYWEEIPELRLDDDYMALMVNPRILDIVNSYLKMYSQIVFYTLQKTDVTGKGERTYSQNWHRDPQEHTFCKVFIYLNDIDENAGPFTYVYGSAYGQKYGELFPQDVPAGVYPPDEEVARAIDPADIHLMTAPAGTVIFCDTIGLHRGGYGTTTPRLMSTFSYGAPTFRENTSYWYSQETAEELKKLPSQSQFAVKKSISRVMSKQ